MISVCLPATRARMNLTRPISQPLTSCGSLYASTSSSLTPSLLCQALDSPFTQKGRDLTSTLQIKSDATNPASLLSISLLLLHCAEYLAAQAVNHCYTEPSCILPCVASVRNSNSPCCYRKKNDSKVKLLVNWAAYESEHDTCDPFKNSKNAPDALQEYWDTVAVQTAAESKELGSEAYMAHMKRIQQ